MLKFKVGDKVKVLSNLKKNSYYDGTYFTSEMSELKGKVVTIVQITGNSKYKIEEDGRAWVWVDEMLESLPTENDKLKAAGINVESDAVAKYIRIGKITLAIPKDTPVGIAVKFVNDEENPLIGQAVALKKLIDTIK